MFTVKVREVRAGEPDTEAIFEALSVCKRPVPPTDPSTSSVRARVYCETEGGQIIYDVHDGGIGHTMYVMNRFGATVAIIDL